ncbi:Hsp20/alpha crystallin family protein [Sinorhizobium medicae]|uniref:Hsp20/alpha crystallin family protein n=1 Tax=Sinorhizobium medicae TaxID=110321 RepID=UPI00307CD7EB
MPGMDANEVEVKLANGILMTGEKKEAKEEREKDRFLPERRYGTFQRSFRLPPRVDADNIDASAQTPLAPTQNDIAAEVDLEDRERGVEAARVRQHVPHEVNPWWTPGVELCAASGLRPVTFSESGIAVGESSCGSPPRTGRANSFVARRSYRWLIASRPISALCLGRETTISICEFGRKRGRTTLTLA